MSQDTWLIIVAGLFAVLIPLVPTMLRLRIKLLRWLRWNRLANWHERHFRPLVVIVRAIMAAFAVVLLAIGLDYC